MRGKKIKSVTSLGLTANFGFTIYESFLKV